MLKLICYPPPYEREIWHYEKANADLIRRSIDQFPWDIRFAHIDVNQKVYLFNQTIKNILCNFIPHETVPCDDRDPPWITSKIKGLIQKNNIAKYWAYRNSWTLDARVGRWTLDAGLGLWKLDSGHYT